jgi:serine O-acetyltransferase
MDYILFYLLGDFWGIYKKCKDAKTILSRNLYRLVYKYFNFRNNSSIGITTKFISAPTFPHGVRSIFISGDALIGSNCIIFQQVTIGSNTIPDSKKLGAPTIGSNCFIGAGAMIIGNVRIGDNCRIGANTIVVEDVPDNCVVVGAKAHILKKENIINKHYLRHEGKWCFLFDNKVIEEVDSDVLRKLNKYKEYDL